ATADAGWTRRIAEAIARDFKIPLDRPWHTIPERARAVLLHGTGDRRVTVKWSGRHGSGSWAMRFEGIIPQLERRWRETKSEAMRSWYGRYFRQAKCRTCEALRLRREARSVGFADLPITDVTRMTVGQAAGHLHGLKLDGARAIIAGEVLKEVHARLGFLLDVGLEYLTLDRSAATL